MHPKPATCLNYTCLHVQVVSQALCPEYVSRSCNCGTSFGLHMEEVMCTAHAHEKVHVQVKWDSQLKLQSGTSLQCFNQHNDQSSLSSAVHAVSLMSSCDRICVNAVTVSMCQCPCILPFLLICLSWPFCSTHRLEGCGVIMDRGQSLHGIQTEPKSCAFGDEVSTHLHVSWSHSI